MKLRWIIYIIALLAALYTIYYYSGVSWRLNFREPQNFEDCVKAHGDLPQPEPGFIELYARCVFRGHTYRSTISINNH